MAQTLFAQILFAHFLGQAVWNLYKLKNKDNDMKAIAIVGFKNSGKTSTTIKLAEALEKKGLKVAIAKHTHHNLDKPETDTARFMKKNRTVVGLGPEESVLFYGEPIPLLKLMPLIKADILLVEGYKEATWLPRIVCLKTPDEISELAGGKGRGRVLATVRQKPEQAAFIDVPHFELADASQDSGGDPNTEPNPELEQLAALVIAKAFALPGLNCGACGLGSCEAFACAVLSGQCKESDCPSLHNEMIEIFSDDRHVALNPFMARLIASMMKSVAAELKGYRPGADLVIRLNSLD